MAAKQMADESILSDDFIRQLIDVGVVDILVGVPTHNDAKTAAPAMRAIQEGIVKTFPRERAVILNAEEGPEDRTAHVGIASSDYHLHLIVQGYAPQALRGP